MRIDSHQHFWRYDPVEYGWISDKMNILKNDFLPLDLKKELNTVQFDGSIIIQARQTLEETRWLLKLADEFNFIKGVVGWVDLCSPEIEKQLVEFSVNPKFVGVRHVIHDEPDDNFMARNDFQQGISLLQNYNLTFDLLLFPKHLPIANKLVEKFPKQKFVLDHIAKPNIKLHEQEPWKSEIINLAKNKNVFCKLSGMATEADWENWKIPDFEFYIDTVIETFGIDRLMIGSDWPVCTVGGSYKEIMNIVMNYFSSYSKEIQQNILGENCFKFYLNNR
jgi:L-fuconolactonase